MPLTAQDKREIAAIVNGIMMKYREGQAIADPTQNLMQTALEGLQAQNRLQALTTRLEQSPGIMRPEDIFIEEAIGTLIVPKKRKKAMTKFNKAVKEGMKIVKASKSYGKAKTINNPKKAFAAVTKTVSKARKGGKLAAKGVMRKVGQKAKSILGKAAAIQRKQLRGRGYQALPRRRR